MVLRQLVKSLIFVAAPFLGGCYDSFEGGGDYTYPVVEVPTPNITIGELSDMLQSERLIVYDDMIVQGSVTTTDRNGSFYKSFIIERDGSALEILEGLYDSFIYHDVGEIISLKLNGLALARSRGILQVGIVPSSGSWYTLDYLSAQPIIDEHIFCSNIFEEIIPLSTTCEELSEQMCGRLISLDSLTHLPAEDDLQPYVWGGYQQFVDNSQNSVWVYTSDYANFSQLSIPQEAISICGILQYSSIPYVTSDEVFIIEMRGVEDYWY